MHGLSLYQLIDLSHGMMTGNIIIVKDDYVRIHDTCMHGLSVRDSYA